MCFIKYEHNPINRNNGNCNFLQRTDQEASWQHDSSCTSAKPIRNSLVQMRLVPSANR